MQITLILLFFIKYASFSLASLLTLAICWVIIQQYFRFSSSNDGTSAATSTPFPFPISVSVPVSVPVSAANTSPASNLTLLTSAAAGIAIENNTAAVVGATAASSAITTVGATAASSAITTTASSAATAASSAATTVGSSAATTTETTTAASSAAPKQRVEISNDSMANKQIANHNENVIFKTLTKMGVIFQTEQQQTKGHRVKTPDVLIDPTNEVYVNNTRIGWMDAKNSYGFNPENFTSRNNLDDIAEGLSDKFDVYRKYFNMAGCAIFSYGYNAEFKKRLEASASQTFVISNFELIKCKVHTDTTENGIKRIYLTVKPLGIISDEFENFVLDNIDKTSPAIFFDESDKKTAAAIILDRAKARNIKHTPNCAFWPTVGMKPEKENFYNTVIIQLRTRFSRRFLEQRTKIINKSPSKFDDYFFKDFFTDNLGMDEISSRHSAPPSIIQEGLLYKLAEKLGLKGGLEISQTIQEASTKLNIITTDINVLLSTCRARKDELKLVVLEQVQVEPHLELEVSPYLRKEDDEVPWPAVDTRMSYSATAIECDFSSDLTPLDELLDDFFSSHMRELESEEDRVAGLDPTFVYFV